MQLDLTDKKDYFEHIGQKEFLRKLILALLSHENRIRALESKAPITKEQLINALKAL